MSPHGRGGGLDGRGFPRVNGDEPTLAAECESQGLFSPRERG